MEEKVRCHYRQPGYVIIKDVIMKKGYRLAWLILFVIFYLPSAAQGPDSNQHALDQFEDFSTDTVVTSLSSSGPASVAAHTSSHEPGHFYWVVAVLAITVIAGIFVRFANTRPFRSLFLVASVVVLGFYAGACPCPIQSMQHGVLALSGTPVKWHSLIYFAGLLPITYLFGRIYCGWICHLGALQELIFRTSGFRLLQGARSQLIMRIIRGIVLLALVIQLLVTQTYLFREIDPFPVVYNFYASHAIGWWLVGILVVSSFLLYRPFCKTICPVGLVLGWISKLPGASVLAAKDNCNACKRCNNQCSIRAITRDGNVSKLDNQECIRCGECLNGCPRDAMGFSFKSKKHPSRTVMNH